ncbi:MAG: imidazole glycerol phosphate synthase subunit HisF [Candidatus Micrarchaeota archaeon]|nr:imidazole glycerol phosphate synthase subunit HisF [Candidatus Micrarchaeota archaeon]
MLAKRIIPCLDVKAGKVVKGVNFKQLKYAGEPAELAGQYTKQGADEVVFLDISASYEKRKTQKKWVQQAAQSLDIPFTVGGGIASVKDMREILRLGADKICINTAAIENPNLITQGAELFGSQCIVVAMDVKSTLNGWRVYSHGGTRPTGLDAVKWAIECQKRGVGELLVTSIDRDGTKNGFDYKLIKAIVQKTSIPIIASGGAGSEEDFVNVFKKGKADAALAASVFHYGKISIKCLKKTLSKNQIPVRK